MTPETYRTALTQATKDLEEAKRRYAQAIEEQENAEEDIAELRQTVAGLSKLCGEQFKEDDDEFGLTDAIRLALKTHGSALNAVQVRNRLEQIGYKVASESSLPSIHTILKRLVLKGELDDSATSDGKTAYRWIHRFPRLPRPKEGGVPMEPPGTKK